MNSSGSTYVYAVSLTITVLLCSASTSGWHQEDEEPNYQFESMAGDPRILEDADDCLEETRNDQDVDCVVLYAHILDLTNPRSLNTQRPPDCSPDLAEGIPGWPNVEPYGNFTRMVLVPEPPFVMYEQNSNGMCDDPQGFSQTRLAYDLNLSKDFPIRGYWYLSADMLEIPSLGTGTGSQSLIPSSGIMPCLTVRMSLQTGPHVGGGDVIAEGQTTKNVFSTPYGYGTNTSTVASFPCPSSGAVIKGEEVAEFVVDLGTPARAISYTENFVFKVQWFQHNGTSGDPREEDNANQADWNLHTGSDYPNRIVLPMGDAVDIRRFKILEGAGSERDMQYVQFNVMTPWQHNDIDKVNYRLELFDDHGANLPMEHLGEHEKYDTDHDRIVTPWNVTIPWNLNAENLEPGTYTLRLTVPNWQHSAEAEKEVTFTVSEPDPQLISGPTGQMHLVAAVSLLGILGILRTPESQHRHGKRK